MRLIDADLLMRKCEKWLKPKAPDEDEMVSVADIAVSTLMEIEEQPTAFDVEKVVALLEEELKLTEDTSCVWWRTTWKIHRCFASTKKNMDLAFGKIYMIR